MFDRLHPRSFPASAAVVVALAVIATAASATGATPSAKARHTRRSPVVTSAAAPAATIAAAPQPASASAPAGLMAFLDPATGLLIGPISSLVPPADQRAAAANVLLEPVQLPSGAWMLDLQGTGMESYVLHIDPLGQRTVTCVQAARVPAVLAMPAPPARKER